MPSMDALKFQAPKQPAFSIAVRHVSVGDAPRPPEVSRRSHSVCFRPSHPLPGSQGVKEVKVGIMAVFDGHNGSEASEMASELLLEYFVLHTYFLLDTTYSILARKLIRRLPNNGEDGPVFQKIEWKEDLDRQILDLGRFKVTLSAILDGSFPYELLKEALVRAIHDIDTAFSKDASRYNLSSGTTATVVLLADTQILVANVGDSKAFLCSETYQSPSEAKATVFRVVRQRRADGVSSSLKEYHHLKSMASNGWTYLIAKELTNDHHPDRADEKSRVESAGGNISEWAGVARVNGQLAVSRAIGDIHFKSFGVISVPEVTDWLPLTANDSYVIAASDGVFEKLSPQDICDILWEPLSHFTTPPEFNSSCLYSLADCIVNTAFERGSMDNLAAIAIPVRGPGPSETLEDRSYTLRQSDYLALGDQKRIYENSSDSLFLNSLQFVYYLRHAACADMLEMFQGQSCSSGFHLHFSLLMELHPLPDVAKFDRLLVEGKHNFGCFYLSENLDVNDDYTFWVHKDDRIRGPLDLYNDQHICVHFGMYIDEDKDQCMNSDGFARFLGLLESIPFHNTGQNEHVTPDTRYILKKKFDRGAYGEVWLAFNWNCSQVGKDLKGGMQKTIMVFYLFLLLENVITRADFHTSEGAVSEGSRIDFIIFFLNASNSLQGSSSSGEPDFVWKISQCNAHGFTHVNESVGRETEEPSSPEDVIFREKRLHGAAYEEGLNHIARYVESFESRSNEIWLVFHHEGISFSKLLYTAEEVVTDDDKEKSERGKRVQILRPSRWWHWLKTTEAGQEEFRNIIWQLLMALKSCHDRNITHRDIKPGKKRRLRRIIDFGSAVNDFTVKHLYGSVGPSSAEQTSDYAPPEAFLNVSWYRGPPSVTAKYDMWSVGVVILELILGSPNVFQISSITQALLDQHLRGWNDSFKELAYNNIANHESIPELQVSGKDSTNLVIPAALEKSKTEEQTSSKLAILNKTHHSEEFVLGLRSGTSSVGIGIQHPVKNLNLTI
ncbi:hypothetical protein DH2020_024884 [Rehmannia glutinosa]|uniref:Uncharacterized protein n=1 Tax=Rehmannia glutinosa TaxID=99300 RepID=A0ABR0W225_REHGL